MNPKVKYQIFVSSTYEDLREERERVLWAILEMGHIPVGMEMFSAGNEQQWKLIQRQIDDCDYYVVIIAHKYGSTDGTLSYTEKEHDYAASKNIPILGFIIDDKTKIAPERIETDMVKKEKLGKFKEKVKSKIINYWDSKEDLYGKVIISLTKQFSETPQVGWARANEIVGADVTKELSRLSTENSELRDSLNKLSQTLSENDISKEEEIISILKKHTTPLTFCYLDSKKFEDETEILFYDILIHLAPEMINEANELTVKRISSVLGFELRPNRKRYVREEYPVGINRVKVILADMQTLGLLERSAEKGDEDNQKWWLTELGIKVFRVIRKRVMEGIA